MKSKRLSICLVTMLTVTMLSCVVTPTMEVSATERLEAGNSVEELASDSTLAEKLDTDEVLADNSTETTSEDDYTETASAETFTGTTAADTYSENIPTDSSCMEDALPDNSGAEDALFDTSTAESALADTSTAEDALTDASVAEDALSDTPVSEEAQVGATIRTDIEDGLYMVVPKLLNTRCMGIAGNSKAAGANVQLIARNGGFATAFYVRRYKSTSRYTFVNYHTGNAVEIGNPATASAQSGSQTASGQSGSQTTNGQTTNSQSGSSGTQTTLMTASVTQNTYTGELNQQWLIEDMPNGSLRIRACGKSLALELVGGKTDVGTDIQACTASGANAQMWTLVKVSGKVAAEARLVDAGLEKGFYRITANCGLGVDITCNSKADNANIRIRSKLNSGAQIFRIFPQGDGTYRINGYNSIKYFDCANAKNGSNIYQAASRKSSLQRWYILKDPQTGKYVIRNMNGSHVVMSAEKEEENGNVGQMAFSGKSSQYWVINQLNGSNIHVEPRDGIYEFRSGLNGNMCLDVAAASTQINGNIQLYKANGSDAQRFAIVGSGYGLYTVMNVNSMRRMHLRGGSGASGTNIVQYMMGATNAQKWHIFWNKNTNKYQIQPYGKTTRVAVAGGKAVNGANIQANTADNSAGQAWTLRKITTYDGTHHIKVVCSGTTCKYQVYQIENGVYKAKLGTSGFVGRNGAGKTREGDGKTPLGTFVVGKAYGIADDPGSVIPYTKVTNDMYWCGRSNSPYYNTLINAAKSGPGDEHLIEYTQAYRYLLDIGYNTACIPGLGSAIFLHCSRNQPTAGCVSIPEDYMVRTLRMIGKGTKITIM